METRTTFTSRWPSVDVVIMFIDDIFDVVMVVVIVIVVIVIDFVWRL